MSILIDQFDPTKEGNFELQIYTNESCENQSNAVQNWTSTQILAPTLANPDSGPPSSGIGMNITPEVTQNTVSFKFFNNSLITHAINYEFYKQNDPLIFPTIDSPSVVADARQFSGVVTITGLEANTTYTLQMASFFLGENFGGGPITFTTDSNITNPDPSTINQDLVIWPRQEVKVGDLFKINAHSSFNDSAFSAPNENNFCDTYYFQEQITTTITNIANYLLQRGWLQKITGSTITGWTVTIIGENKIVNLDVSGSNTYNAIIDLVNLSNMQVKFNYENETIIFIDRESSSLDKNYTLRRGFNLQNFDVSYSGDNMSSIFYVDAAEDEFGLKTLLSEETTYKDNFLFDFNYFRSKDLISESDLTTIENKINVDLKKINEELSSSIKNRFNHLGLIREARTQIESIAELLAIPTVFNDYAQRFLDLQSQFYRPSLGQEQVTTTDNFKVLKVFWIDVQPNFNIVFPIKFRYRLQNYVQEQANQSVTINPYGFKIQIFLQDGSGRIPWPSDVANPKVYLEITNEGNVQFDINNFQINFVDVQFNLTTEENKFIFFYPYFDLLNEFDGEKAITRELQRIQQDVQTFIDFKNEDEIELACLIGNDNQVPGCEEINFSDDPFINQQRIALLESRIEDYKTVIGEELTGGAFIPGKFTLILDTFEKYLSGDETISLAQYTRPEINRTIMEMYRTAEENKQQFWYDLKEDRQHIFIEGYYENNFETNVVSLKAQAEAAFTDHNKPLEDFSLSYINVSDIVGVDIQDISVGDFVSLKEEKLKVITNEDSKLKVAAISRVLRDKGNINLTIFRYNMINQILEKIITRNQ